MHKCNRNGKDPVTIYLICFVLFFLLFFLRKDFCNRYIYGFYYFFEFLHKLLK